MRAQYRCYQMATVDTASAAVVVHCVERTPCTVSQVAVFKFLTLDISVEAHSQVAAASVS